MKKESKGESSKMFVLEDSLCNISWCYKNRKSRGGKLGDSLINIEVVQFPLE